jgi:hypothetical protein
MATKSHGVKSDAVPKKPAPEKIDPNFIKALNHIEKMAKDYISNAKDPFKMGCKLSNEIRNIAERIDSETIAEGMSLTEAAYSSETIVGVGVGVI